MSKEQYIDPSDDKRHNGEATEAVSSHETRLVQIFRSAREAGLYLYVDKQEGLARVPEELLSRFGKPESAMLLMLSADRKLARADAGNVLKAIAFQGFYLQLPPELDKELLMMRLNNPKLR